VTVLSIWSPEDALLGYVAPLALALAADTALVIDLDPNGPDYPGEGSLASLAAEGPRRADLHPERRGVALLRNGGVDASSCGDLLDALCEGWPAVVLRLPAATPDVGGAAVVAVRLLLPEPVTAPERSPAVYQRCGWRVRAPGPGPVLPRPRRASLRALVDGRRPPADRWLRSWSQVWEHPWT
jgi:hypothetical protein